MLRGYLIPMVCFLLFAGQSFSQDSLKTTPNGTDGMVFIVRDTGVAEIKKLPPNEFQGSKSNFKIGFGFIYDFATYAKDEVFEQQLDSAKLSMGSNFKLRDFRILGSGVFKTKRYIAFKFAYMWDGDKGTWLVRETGLTIGVPELKGHFFIGRTKEGFSMIKVMNGHSGITNERQMALDVIPIMADGIKWFGYIPKARIFWNLGYFNDMTSKGQGFSTYAWQGVARVGWMPFNDPKNNKLMHLAANLRYGKPLNGKITLKSRPESNPAPFLINTGEIQTDKSSHIGAEAYYSNGPLMIGTEVVQHHFYSDKTVDHVFSGGDVIVSYMFKGGKRPYNTVGSIYGFVPVRKSIFKGGWGEWEAVVRFSKFSLNDADIKGGSFWRITPMVNWYLAKQVRMEFVYGYGEYDRFNLKGKVQFFETRLQLTVL